MSEPTLVAVPVDELLRLKELVEQSQVAIQDALANARWSGAGLVPQVEEVPAVDEAAEKFAAYRGRVRGREAAAAEEKEGP